MNRDIFEDLFVLEMANNHSGRLDKGLRIITEFSQIVRFNNIRAGIKLQFRDLDSFFHKDFRERRDIKYVKKTLDRQLSNDDLAVLVNAIRKSNCIPICTPFDEHSVDLCNELGIQIIKIASAYLNDWFLIEKIAAIKKPVIVSTGGYSQKDLDDLVMFFEHRNIPLAINHCVAIYPTEDYQLELNQIDLLKNRYPNHTIGLSSHEYHDWFSSMLVAYAKGARTFERHIDIEIEGIEVPSYCSLPNQTVQWIQAYKKAKEMCGVSGTQKRTFPEEELKYLDTQVRGVYAKRNLEEGQILSTEDVYLAVPLQRGQICCREFMSGEVLLKPCEKDQPVTINIIDSPYANDVNLRKSIYERGL